MKYIYGPVQSRRLGLSLGVSLAPYKICNFDCIYCQLGRSNELTETREEYVNIEDILGELKSWFSNNVQEATNLNYITISGLGEPTLHKEIGKLIAEIKKITPQPLAVITNASLLNDAQVRKDLLGADLIVPSLDTIIPETFLRINRPFPGLRIDEIINGLIGLRREFQGKIWLEVMLVRGVNDSLSQIRKLKDIVDKINPDKIQLNSPVRTTAEANVFPASKRKLEKTREILGPKCEII